MCNDTSFSRVQTYPGICKILQPKLMLILHVKMTPFLHIAIIILHACDFTEFDTFLALLAQLLLLHILKDISTLQMLLLIQANRN